MPQIGVEEKIEDGVHLIKDFFGLKRRDINEGNDVKICLQRKIITDDNGNKDDIVKTNNKCVENNLNKWLIIPSNDGKFFLIISVYDGKCLNYSDDRLSMQKCNKNNKYKDFIIVQK